MTKTRSIFISLKETILSANKSVVFWRVISSIFFLKVLYDQSRQYRGRAPSYPFPPSKCIHPVKYETKQRNDSFCNPDSSPTFWSLAVGVGTDKVELPPGIWPAELAIHNYQWAYEKYIRPKRCENLKLMEMGLGCKMPYSQSHGSAEGRSIRLWLSFLPKASISVFEYDETCAQNWYKYDPRQDVQIPSRS